MIPKSNRKNQNIIQPEYPKKKRYLALLGFKYSRCGVETLDRAI